MSLKFACYFPSQDQPAFVVVSASLDDFFVELAGCHSTRASIVWASVKVTDKFIEIYVDINLKKPGISDNSCEEYIIDSVGR